MLRFILITTLSLPVFATDFSFENRVVQARAELSLVERPQAILKKARQLTKEAISNQAWQESTRNSLYTYISEAFIFLYSKDKGTAKEALRSLKKIANNKNYVSHQLFERMLSEDTNLPSIEIINLSETRALSFYGRWLAKLDPKKALSFAINWEKKVSSVERSGISLMTPTFFLLETYMTTGHLKEAQKKLQSMDDTVLNDLYKARVFQLKGHLNESKRLLKSYQDTPLPYWGETRRLYFLGEQAFFEKNKELAKNYYDQAAQALTVEKEKTGFFFENDLLDCLKKRDKAQNRYCPGT